MVIFGRLVLYCCHSGTGTVTGMSLYLPGATSSPNALASASESNRLFVSHHTTQPLAKLSP